MLISLPRRSNSGVITEAFAEPNNYIKVKAHYLAQGLGSVLFGYCSYFFLFSDFRYGDAADAPVISVHLVDDYDCCSFVFT